MVFPSLNFFFAGINTDYLQIRTFSFFVLFCFFLQKYKRIRGTPSGSETAPRVDQFESTA